MTLVETVNYRMGAHSSLVRFTLGVMVWKMRPTLVVRRNQTVLSIPSLTVMDGAKSPPILPTQLIPPPILPTQPTQLIPLTRPTRLIPLTPLIPPLRLR